MDGSSRSTAARTEGARRDPGKGSTGTVGSSLVAEDLAVGYPETDEPVVECSRIDVPAGEITALVGPNGSGKSTLLKALSNELSADEGRIELDGRDIQSFGRKELARAIGHLPQENSAPGSLTVEELAYHGRYPHRGPFESVTESDRRAVDRAVQLAGVDHIRAEGMGQLSGGQRQLAWISMVLAQETDVLLLDEPTTFLDLHHRLLVMEAIRRLNEEEGVTVGVVLHDIALAARFADYLVALDDGTVYDWGPPMDVLTEELLADVFGVDATVDSDAHGGQIVTPHRPLERDDRE